MSIGGMLNQPLAVIRRTEGAPYDERGHGTVTEAATVIMGRLQYKRAFEMAQLNQAGATVGDVTIWVLGGTDVRGADVIRRDPDDGQRFEVTGIRPDPKTGEEFLTIDARLVTA